MSAVTTSPEDQLPLPQPKRRHWGYWISLLSLTAISGAAAMGALIWVSVLPPIPTCDGLTASPTDSERLYCAQQEAQSGKLDDLMLAINLVKSWSKDHPRYSEGQSLMTEWSKAVLGLAYQQVAQGDLKQAIGIAQKIPSQSSIYREAQDAITGWKSTQNEGQLLYETIQAAIRAQEWDQATDQIQALSRLNNDFWRERLNELRQQLGNERQARNKLEEAKNYAQYGTRLDLKEAIAQQVKPKTYTRDEAQAAILRWSRQLIQMATAQLRANDLTGALETAAIVPLKSTLRPEADLLIQLGRTQQSLVSQSAGQPNALVERKFWSLLGSVTVFQNIDPKNSLYPIAQRYVTTWKDQLKDLVQLQTASSIARLGYIPAFQLAIDYAQAIEPKRPQRLQAQTLVAFWRKEIERIEDRPYLVQARTLAKAGTIPQLKAAIAQASQVKPDRALRREAQAAISQWNRRIQTIEDKPLLDQGVALAKQGKLEAAIQMVNRIRPGRALYAEANRVSRQWVAGIQIAADQPLLDQARAKAAIGNLTEAINIAAQIGYGRTLYDEAQSAIAAWTVERDAILRARAQEAFSESGEASEANDPAPSEAPPEDNSVEPAPVPEEESVPSPDPQQ